MNMVNVLLLVLLVGVIIFDSIMQNGLREKLRRADVEVIRLQGERNKMEAEYHSELRYAANKLNHERQIRDDKIKEQQVKYLTMKTDYEEKLRIQEERYQMLADISNKALADKSGK